MLSDVDASGVAEVTSMDSTAVSMAAVTKMAATAVKPAVKRSSPSDRLLELQQQTLNTVLAIADTQRQLLDVEKARLEVELENVSLKKIKLLSKGVYVNTRTAGQAIYLQQPRASIDASPPAVRFGLGAALRRPASVDRSIL